MSKVRNFKTKPTNPVDTLPIKTTATGPAVNSAPTRAASGRRPDSAWLPESHVVQSAKNSDSAVVSTREKGLLTQMGTGIKKIAEVADRVDKIRNAIEGLYKLARVLWPIFLLMWPN